MSLKKNILSNYISQIYVTIIGIVMVPLYLRYMGAEAYGLVGFFAMLQSWFNLLDVGLTPTIARETARFRGGALDAITFRRLVRALEGIFLFIAILGCCLILVLSGQISTNWLTVRQLPVGEIETSIQIMAGAISMRWMCGLYRGQITGSERLVMLSVYNIVIATMRFIGVLIILHFYSTSPTAFFGYQLCIALIEISGLKIMSSYLLPKIPVGERVSWSWTPLKPILKFSTTIAFTSSVWVLVTQTDKLVLSKILPLSEYGYFSIAVLVASGISIISGPVSAAITPRMAKLEAEGDHAGLISTYRKATQLVTVIAGSFAVTVAFCAGPLLVAWTGDKVLAQHASPVLILYAIGNGILAVSAFPFYLQYAKGNLRLHLIGNALFVLFLIPTIIWAASKYGSIGAGYTWLCMNLIYFIFWIPLVHNKFEPGLNRLWYGRDVLMICLMTVLSGFFITALVTNVSGRWWILGSISCVAILLLIIGFLGTSNNLFKLKRPA